VIAPAIAMLALAGPPAWSMDVRIQHLERHGQDWVLRAAVLDTQGVENGAPVIVQNQERRVAAIGGAIRTEGCHLALGDPRRLVDVNASAGERANRLGESVAVIGIGREVDTETAMAQARLRLARNRKYERGTEQTPHVD